MSGDLTNAQFVAMLVAKAEELAALLQSAAAAQDGEWVTPSKARTITGLTTKRLAMLANKGVLTPKRIGAGHRRYNRAQLLEVSKIWEVGNG